MKNKLIHLVTQWDVKQSKTKHHNPYALGIYMQAVDTVMAEIEKGKALDAALEAAFDDRLLDFIRKGMA